LGAFLSHYGWHTIDVDLVNQGTLDDLADDLVWNTWKERIAKMEFTFLFAGTLCETFSHARQFSPGPPPLRSAAHLHGLPGLSPAWREKVRLANLLVSRTIEACRLIFSVGGGFAVENPEPWADGSPSMFHLFGPLYALGASHANFDQCRFGSEAVKPTRILFAGGGFQAMDEIRCDHPRVEQRRPDGAVYFAAHRAIHGRRTPDGEWATKAYRAYPPRLNEVIAAHISAFRPRASPVCRGS